MTDQDLPQKEIIADALATIKDAATIAAECLDKAASCLAAAEQSTGYKFDWGIMNEIGQGYRGSARDMLQEIVEGELDEDITNDLLEQAEE